jgi:hypothetical protein
VQRFDRHRLLLLVELPLFVDANLLRFMLLPVMIV